MILHRGFPARQAGRVHPARRWRIPWRLITRLCAVLAAFFGLIKVIAELWLKLHAA